MSLLSFHSNKKTRGRSGFGLIELMVSISIMAFIMAVVFARQDTFNTAVLLRSQAYEVALQLREVQLYAVSAATIKGENRQQLGATFNLATPQVYKIAQHSLDEDTNELDAGVPFGAPGVIDKRFAISDIRDENDADLGDVVTVLFERPNFDARFFDGAGEEITTTSLIEIDITRVGSTDVRTVEVTSAGQIRVQ